MTSTVHASRAIAASPDTVWAMVSDLPRMGEWSPEATGGKWIKGATTAAVGAKFSGTNAQGAKQWSTIATVTECVPGVCFAFDVDAAGMAVANWRYDIVATETGCTVTETWTDRRGKLVVWLGGIISGIKERSSHNLAGIETTLANLAAAAEAASA